MEHSRIKIRKKLITEYLEYDCEQVLFFRIKTEAGKINVAIAFPKIRPDHNLHPGPGSRIWRIKMDDINIQIRLAQVIQREGKPFR